MMNLLRVPPEVELAGLDAAEYRPDIHVPEFALGEDLVIEPDGATRTPAARVQAEAFRGRDPRREPDDESERRRYAGTNRQRT